MTNIEKIKQVLKGAPEGATHIDLDGDYWDELYPCDKEQKYDLQNAGWIDHHGFRSLDDLRTILSQHEEIERLRDFAKEVKKQLNKNGEYAPLSHIWVDSVIAGKDLEEEKRKAFPPKEQSK